MARFEVSTSIGDPIEASGHATGRGGETYGQRRFQLWVGRECISVYVYGDDETRALMKALASASGGLLATLPDEYAPLDERDESALLVAVQDHVGEGVADDGA